jgi:hypothetical protein
MSELRSTKVASSQTSSRPVKCEEYGAPEKIRTSDLQLRRLPLYPAELRARSSSLASIVAG